MSNASNINSSLIRPAYDLEETPELWKTWSFGFMIITAASFLSPAAILMIPLLRETLYERIMVFLVALGIGAMSGSCIFILIPQAFDITEVAKIDYVTKSWLMISALYVFFAVDRVLQCIIEYRRRRRSHRKVHVSTLNAIMKKCRPKSRKCFKVSQIHGESPYKHYESDAETGRQQSISNKRNNYTETEMPVTKRQNSNGALSHQHSLIIDENGNVVTAKRVLDANQILGAGTVSSNGIVHHKFPHNYQYHYRHRRLSPIAKHRHNRAKSTNDMDEKLRQLKEERHDLEDDLEVAMVNNVLTRTLSTRRSVAAIVRSKPDMVQVESEDGNITVLPSGIERRKDSSNKVQQRKRKRPGDLKTNEELDVELKIHEKVVIEKSNLEIASVAYMIIFGSSANNFVDGMSTGAAFSDSIIRGITIGLAVLSQQFPQELGTLAILAKSGLGIRRALLFNMLPITLSYIGFAFGVFLDNVDDSYDSFIFAISAGMYFYIFLGTLIPEIRQSFQETLRRSTREAALTTALQFSGISFGICFLYLMN